MKEKTYCVVGTAEGTVTSASGVVIASFSANEQSYFTAPAGGFVTISDDTAIVTPVFDLAPSALVGKSSGGASGGKNTLVYTFADDGTYTVEGDLSGATDGSYMFNSSKNLTSFSSDLSALTNGSSMFRKCTKLTSFEIDLSALTNCSCMFMGCTNLTSFSSDLSALTNGYCMFNGCSKLTSFSSDLSALNSGDSMFAYCKLDLASVQNIANTINTVSSGTIYIGMSSTIQDTDDLNTALEAIRAKGWTVQEQYNS